MNTQAQDLIALVDRGEPRALEAALEQGADPDGTDRWGVTALARAAARGDLEAVEILLARGARVDKLSDAGNSALMAAAARGDLAIMTALLEAGADPRQANKWGFGPEDWGSWPANAREVRDLLRSRSD